MFVHMLFPLTRLVIVLNILFEGLLLFIVETISVGSGIAGV
jgi:hypothetical protein